MQRARFVRLLRDSVLVLFDIDGTLLRSYGAGVSGFVAAGRAHFGSRFSLDGIQLAGRLDSLILADAIARFGGDVEAVEHGAFVKLYSSHLELAITAEGASCNPMPGAMDLVQRVAAHPEMTCGVLTGNWQETGVIKLTAAGFDLNLFEMTIWASDGVDRPGLVEEALRRWSGTPAQVTVIGDTIHDVQCGRVHGCRTIAVATGGNARAELDATEADLVLDDLSDTDSLMRHLSSWST